MNGTRRHRGIRATAGLAACMAVALGACGSSKSSTSSSTTASSGSGSTAAAGGSSQVAAAQQIVTKAEQAPTAIPLTTPLSSPPPKGKLLVDLQCEITQCADIAAAEQQATSAAGWSYKVIPFKSADPATLIAALNQALQYKPVAVTFTGLPEAVWASEVPAYQKAGVAMIPGYIGPTPINSTIIGNIDGPDDLKYESQILVSEIVAESGTNAHILFNGVPDFPILADVATDFNADVKTSCSGCQVTNLNLTIPQIDSNAAVPAIVSALQKDPSIKDFITVDGPFIQGLPSALKAAGITGVKIFGGGATIENEQDILSGTETAFTGLATRYGAWLAVDMAIRHAEGMSFPSNDGGLPNQLLTKSTVGTPTDSLDRPADYAAEMKKLWMVS